WNTCTVEMPGRLIMWSGVTLHASGQIGAEIQSDAGIHLDGDLTVTGAVWQTSGDIWLGGFTLAVQGSTLRNDAGNVYLQNGTLTVAGSTGVIVRGALRGVGTVTANRVALGE